MGISLPGDLVVVNFGTLGQILSNDSIQAPLHRVVDAPPKGGVVPRRSSVVVFVDADPEVELQPYVPPGHSSRFQSGILAGDFKMKLYKGIVTIDDVRSHRHDSLVDGTGLAHTKVTGQDSLARAVKKARLG